MGVISGTREQLKMYGFEYGQSHLIFKLEQNLYGIFIGDHLHTWSDLSLVTGRFLKPLGNQPKVRDRLLHCTKGWIALPPAEGSPSSMNAWNVVCSVHFFDTIFMV